MQMSLTVTHDVDEMIILADNIVPMTNAPKAKIAEVVVNTPPSGAGPCILR